VLIVPVLVVVEVSVVVVPAAASFVVTVVEV
jgi:hypothetical protein